MDTKMGKKDIVQAVVLSEDFVTNLTPMHHIYPSILMPIINVPLLDYLMETLIKCGIQELFLYCSRHIDLIKAYINKRKWPRIVVSLIISEGCLTLGDALRDIDTKGTIRGNFILIRGDAFINADLMSALNNHRSKLRRDKGATITMLMRNFGSTNDSLLRKETFLLVSDKTSNKVLHYSKLRFDEKKVKLELNWFLDHSEIEINTCYMDSHVYMCSPAVLPLFSDNFDFQTMEDFIRGVLMNEEILNSRIYWQQLNPEEYSLPVISWNAYQILNRDILNRYSFPLTLNSIPFLKNFIHMPRSTYKHRSASLAKGCTLEKDSVLCQNSTLGNDTSVTRSVIGHNCLIGSNVKIKNSYVLSDTKIEDNCTIANSIIFPNCVIKNATQINKCILHPGIIIDERTEYNDSILELKDNEVIATKMSEIENGDFEFFNDYHTEESDNDYHAEDDYSTDDYSADDTNTNVDSENNSPIPDDTDMFLYEVIDSLLRGFQDKLKCENLILEINSSRYAYNITMNEVTYNVIKAILNLPFHYHSEKKETANKQEYQEYLKIMVSYFQPIILNYVKTEDAQDDCLRAIEDVANSTEELLPVLEILLLVFYNKDVLSEEKILKWYRSSGIKNNKIKTAIKRFIAWLEEPED
ncbi:eukaryotic translation initiation factor 2B subunit epsilon [Augochlora pura]